jgi:hypothetical protein
METSPLHQARVAIHSPCRPATAQTAAATEEDPNPRPATHTSPATKAAAASARGHPASQTTASSDAAAATRAIHAKGTRTSAAASRIAIGGVVLPVIRGVSGGRGGMDARGVGVLTAGVGEGTMTFTGGGRISVSSIKSSLRLPRRMRWRRRCDGAEEYAETEERAHADAGE